MTVMDCLQAWLTKRLSPEAAKWLEERLALVAGGDRKALFLAFGLAVRKTGKADLQLTPEELAQAEQARPGWCPTLWSVDQAARTLLILSYPSERAAEYRKTLDQLFSTGEVQELVALYQALPLLPHPEEFVFRGTEGIRTNIKSVFCAVAHQNPYPAEHFSDDQWNQMVLKAIFINVPLAPIIGLDQRANATLARILFDYAQERKAAHRPVTPELWRCVGPFADEAMSQELRRLAEQGTELEQEVAQTALARGQR